MRPTPRPPGRATRSPSTTAAAALGILWAALALAACGLVAEPSEAPAPTTQRQPPPPPPADAPPPAPPPVPRTVAAAPPPAKTYPPPSHLAGLKAAAVVRLLGPPRLKRRDAPAELWQYRTGTCALDLFLYPDGAGGPYRVRHFETRGLGDAPASAAECFAGLLEAEEKRRAG